VLKPTVLFYCTKNKLNFVLHTVSFPCSTFIADLIQSSALTMHHTTGTEHTSLKPSFFQINCAEMFRNVISRT